MHKMSFYRQGGHHLSETVNPITTAPYRNVNLSLVPSNLCPNRGCSPKGVNPVNVRAADREIDSAGYDIYDMRVICAAVVTRSMAAPPPPPRLPPFDLSYERT
ncbi:unnamed protein product [Laminaria digitata]